MKGQEKRKSEDNMVLFVNWEQRKKVAKGIAKGTYYKTYYDYGEFAGWRTKEDIQTYYPNKP